MTQTTAIIPPRLYPLNQTQNHKVSSLRRLMVLRTNQGLLTSFACVSVGMALLIYLETLRMLIPGSAFSRDELHSMTSGFSNDIPSRAKRENGDLMLRHRRPGAVVAGFSQCGGHVITTALSAHPDVVINTRDIKYFTQTANQSLSWYVSHMPPSLDHHVTVDVSYGYVTSLKALARIKEFNNTIKVIIVVCDPISRLLTRFAERQSLIDSKKKMKAVTQNFMKSKTFTNTNTSKEQSLIDSKKKMKDVSQNFIKSKRTSNTNTSTEDSSGFNTDAFKSWLYSTKLNSQTLHLVGGYYKYFKRVFATFLKSQVLVVDKGEFYSNPDKGLSQLHHFLSVHEVTGIDKLKHRRSKQDWFCYTIAHGKEKCVDDFEKRALPVLRRKNPSFLHNLVKFFNKSNHYLYSYLEHDYGWL